SEAGLATRLAVAYPLARKFRTGATLIMYSIVMFTIVLITQINAVIGASVNSSVAQATAGYSVRVDFNPNAPIVHPVATLPSRATLDTSYSTGTLAPPAVPPGRLTALATLSG